MMPKDITTQPPYLTQGKDNVRAIVNRVKLPTRPNPGERDGDREASSVRRSADGWVKMGGGFVYRSNIPVDPSRPTPSRPSYSHGLFLFPFSSEDAAKMLDAGSNSSANPTPAPAAMVKDATLPQQQAGGGEGGRGEPPTREEARTPGRTKTERGRQTQRLPHHDERLGARPGGEGQAYVVSISRNTSGPEKQPPERLRSQS